MILVKTAVLLSPHSTYSIASLTNGRCMFSVKSQSKPHLEPILAPLSSPTRTLSLDARQDIRYIKTLSSNQRSNHHGANYYLGC